MDAGEGPSLTLLRYAWVLYVLEFVVVCLLLSRVVRSGWFRQLLITCAPTAFGFFLNARYGVPWTALRWEGHDTTNVRRTVGLLTLVSFGLGAGVSFRKGGVGFAMVLFSGMLAWHFVCTAEINPSGMGSTRCDVQALLAVWTLREFWHQSSVAAFLMGPATVVCLIVAYESSGWGNLHRPLLTSVFRQTLVGVGPRLRGVILGGV